MEVPRCMNIDYSMFQKCQLSCINSLEMMHTGQNENVGNFERFLSEIKSKIKSILPKIEENLPKIARI